MGDKYCGYCVSLIVEYLAQSWVEEKLISNGLY